MSKYVICGDFYGKTITGIQRVAYETVAELDLLVEKDSLEVVVPADAVGVPTYQNIRVVRIHAEHGHRHLWIQLWYARYLRKNHSVGITICNEVPLFRPGIAYLHDIYYKLYPGDFEGFGRKLSRVVVLLMYRAITKRAKHIITVSQTSRQEIIDTYHVDPKRITVVNCAWQHVLRIKEDETIFEKYPNVKKGEYFFTLGSLAKRKNIKWIIDYADSHPADMFLLSGRVDDFFADRAMPANVILLGYVSDSEMAALMKHCKAFVFPTLYEGFGIPPLEAMAFGAKAIVSNRSCMPEVYGDTAYYLDLDSATDLNQILLGEVAPAEKVLSHYSWGKSAEKLRKIIHEDSIG